MQQGPTEAGSDVGSCFAKQLQCVVGSGGSSDSVVDDCISSSLAAALQHWEIRDYSDGVMGAGGRLRLSLTNLLFFCCLFAAHL